MVSPATRNEKEVREGSFYRLYVETPEYTGIMDDDYREVVPNEKLVYSWE